VHSGEHSVLTANRQSVHEFHNNKFMLRNAPGSASVS